MANISSGKSISAIAGRPPKGVISIAGGFGNAMEWYDFAIYGFMSSVLAQVFFPYATPLTAILNTLAIFGLAFFIRPLGSLILGPLGDRRGRQFALLLSLGLMAAATFAIGLLPSAHTIGVAAPILLILCRMLQGFSAGGEVGPAISFLVEHAPPRRRAFLGSFFGLSSVAGLLFASFVTFVLTSFITNDQLVDWGWRVPFLLSLPLAIIGLFIRRRITETPEFAELADQKQTVRRPLLAAFREDWRAILRIAGTAAVQQAAYYTAFLYFASHMKSLGYATSTATAVTTVALVVSLVLAPLFGALADRVGGARVLFAAAIGLLLVAIPVFAIVEEAALPVVILCNLLLVVGVTAFTSVTPSVFAETLSTRTRSGGLSIGYNLGAMVFGAPALYIMTLIQATVDASWAPGILVVATAIISIVALLSITRNPTRHAVKAIDDRQPAG